MAVRASRAALSVTSPCRRWTITLLLLWFASTSAVDNAAERSIDGAPDMALIHQRPPSQMTGNVEENIATDELPSTVTVIETSTPRVVFIEKIGYEDEGGSKDGSPDVEKHLKKVLNVQQEDFFEISSRNLTEVLPVIERITSEVCRNETRMLFQELARSTPWAVQKFSRSRDVPSVFDRDIFSNELGSANYALARSLASVATQSLARLSGCGNNRRERGVGATIRPEHTITCSTSPNARKRTVLGVDRTRPTERMFDSSTKTPEGIVIGSTFNFGNFDECVGVRGPPRAEGEPEIQGQYCLMEVIMADPRVKPPERGYMEYHYILNYKLDGHKYLSSRIGSSNHYLLHWAVCIPSGCNSHDLKEFLVDNFYGLGQELQVHVNVRDDMCHYDKKVTFDKWDIIFMSIMAVYLTIVIVGTTFSLLVKRRSPNTSVFEDLLLAFSVSENLGKLSSHTPSELGMDCVFGFKFYAMFMILGGHSLLFLIGGPVLNETGVNKGVRFYFSSLVTSYSDQSTSLECSIAPAQHHACFQAIRALRVRNNFRSLIFVPTLLLHIPLWTQAKPDGIVLSVYGQMKLTLPYTDYPIHSPQDSPTYVVHLECKHLGKTTFSTFDRYLNFDLHATGSQVYSESSALDHAATEVVRSIANEPFKNNQVFVDTFFLVSGFLLSRLLLVELDKKKRVNLFSFFALRYIRSVVRTPRSWSIRNSTRDYSLNIRNHETVSTNEILRDFILSKNLKENSLQHGAASSSQLIKETKNNFVEKTSTTRAELDPGYRILKYLKNILLAGAMVDPTAETPLLRVPSLTKVVEVPPSTLGCSSLR
uniref:Nose resistant-to-fluoxetine protein N-terminal domain-containing protein n=1 Tax=Timema poppense TaxID=170557 RepID=A0A7R9H0C0_TIMPO|nr:unnamed protein product [Timema poppensis]